MLHNVFTRVLSRSLNYSSYFYSNLREDLCCFVFPLEWQNLFLFLIQMKRQTRREQSCIEIKCDSKIFCNSFFCYFSSFRCSLSLFFTLFFQLEHGERLKEQTVILNVFSLFFTWTSLFLFAFQLMLQGKVPRPTTQPHYINIKKIACWPSVLHGDYLYLYAAFATSFCGTSAQKKGLVEVALLCNLHHKTAANMLFFKWFLLHSNLTSAYHFFRNW